MSSPFDLLDPVWLQQPDKPLLIAVDGELNYAQFIAGVEHYAAQLQQWQVKSLALQGDNSAQWVLVDFACQLLDIPFLPLPGYFTPAQLKHSVVTAGCDCLLSDNPAVTDLFDQLPGAVELRAQKALDHYRAVSLAAEPAAMLPPQTAKVTFTSGSTGRPKGVCLSQAQQWQVARALQQSLGLPGGKHLCILPLATLLENVAGIYAALLNGSTVMIPGLAALGFNGSSGLAIATLLAQISAAQMSSLITTPEILSALVMAAERGWAVPSTLDFVAVGGARVAAGLTARAAKAGIAAFEGYGLSECGSVVSVNTPDRHQPGGAGQVLPHVRVSLCDGEVIVDGPLFLGYASDKSTWGQTRYATGDLGSLDEQGYLQISGRKKNLLISSFGRNINPEWVEAELLASGLLRQAFVFGDGKPWCVAALHPLYPTVTREHIDAWIQQVNRQLPDYAQIKGWFLLSQAILPDSGLLTANGRPKRSLLLEFFNSQIDRLYQVRSLAEAQLETEQ